MAQAATYSFKDLSGGFTHPLTGPFAFAGQIGIGRAVIDMTVDQSVLDVAADGLVMPSALIGDNGTVAFEMQQTSILHAFFLRWYNLITAAKKNGDVSTWASGALSLVSKVDGSTHQLTGVMPTKIPPKTYGPQGERLTWTLVACDIQNVTP
jgi:hypothetical protein